MWFGLPGVSLKTQALAAKISLVGPRYGTDADCSAGSYCTTHEQADCVSCPGAYTPP